MNEYIQVLKKYWVFNGRAGRREYWVTFFVNLIISFLLWALTFGYKGFNLIPILYSLAVLSPVLGVIVRRLHDTNRSGWWFFINFIPFIGAVVLLTFLLQKSQPAENKYGPIPVESKVSTRNKIFIALCLAVLILFLVFKGASLFRQYAKVEPIDSPAYSTSTTQGLAGYEVRSELNNVEARIIFPVQPQGTRTALGDFYYGDDSSGVGYSVTVFPRSESLSTEDVLSKVLVSGFGSDGTLIASQRLDFRNYPAVDYFTKDKSGEVFQKGRLVAVGSFLYNISIGYQTEYNQERYDQFINSLEFQPITK